jgi:predicted esterase
VKRAILITLLLVTPALAQESPYPKGSSSQNFAGLKFQLVVPDDYDPGKTWSLVVVLHGAGGTETGMAGTLQPLARDGFVVCAPKSTGQTWNTPDIGKVGEIVRHLRETLSIGDGLHSMGFSNGGWNLAPLAFDEKLHFKSACWVAAGYNGGKVPKWARKEMGCMALAGTEDGNAPHARKTVDLLEDKVRSVECHLQPGLGHSFPNKLLPYYFYWVKVMDGRFVPGEDGSFPWKDDPGAAKERMAGEKRGGFFYFYSKGDAEKKEARALQNEVFFDRYVRFFGEQLVAVKLEREQHEDLFAELGLKTTPAVAVLDPSGKVTKKFEKKFKAKSLASALRKHAKQKRPPK